MHRLRRTLVLQMLWASAVFEVWRLKLFQTLGRLQNFTQPQTSNFKHGSAAEVCDATGDAMKGFS